MADNTELTNFNINSDDFKFVQKEVKIADVKFESKPTTYLKDAFRRFRKNKSSVVASFILGIIILLAIFGPIFSPYDTSKYRLPEQFLEPKLFNSGTGFWDGTVKKKDVVYDVDNKCPANYYAPAVSNIVVDKEPLLVDKASTYGKNGYFVFSNETLNSSSSDDSAIKELRSTETKFTSANNYKVQIVLRNEDNVFNNRLGTYKVYLSYSDAGVQKELLLKDWSKDYSTYTLDISAALKQAGLKSVKGRLVFALRAADNALSYILIQKCIFTADVSEAAAKELSLISINDATQSVQYNKDPQTQKFPIGYWASTGVKNVYKSEVYHCSFTYDTYQAAFDTREYTLSYADLKSYAEKGYCSFSESDIKGTFKVLNDRCPIESIKEASTDRFGNPTNIVGNVSMYKFYGYESMPKFLFGTDQYGRDMFTKAFSGLRTSLLLGIFTATFCLLFGLCWGAISGYFGGNVDLAMERFCDILGGVPTMVVLTLCILHLGNNLFTFFLALCLTGWMGTAGRTRTQFYRFKGREYVLASRTLGASDMRLIFRHILPNALGTIVTSAVLMIPSVIYSEASIAYLNLGLQGVDSFGVLLSENQKFLSVYPYLVVFPAVIIALLMISFNLFGNGLRDALNPSLKGSD